MCANSDIEVGGGGGNGLDGSSSRPPALQIGKSWKVFSMLSNFLRQFSSSHFMKWSEVWNDLFQFNRPTFFKKGWKMVDESRKLHFTATVVNKFEENRIWEVQILYTSIADSDNMLKNIIPISIEKCLRLALLLTVLGHIFLQISHF